VRRLVAVALSLVVVLCAGLWLGGHPTVLPGFVRGAFVDDDAEIVAEAIDKVHDTYYREIPTSTLADQSITGLVAGLDDRFSNYFTPKQYAQFRETQSSEFSGIGVTVAPDRAGLRVVQVFDQSPAQRAGIRRGDIITGAGSKSLKGLDQAKASSLIKGPSGTSVRLELSRGGDTRHVEVTRATVSVPQVSSRIVRYHDQKVGYVALAQFGSGAHAEVYAALRKLDRAGAKRFVFDLRHNGGGLVSEAQLIASAFLKDGPIVTTKGRSVPTRTLSATGDPVEPHAPLVVLVDRDTASASEIVTGALQDRDRAEVVGTRTFGKGVFQEVVELSNGGALDITAGQYFTPKGRNLGGRGVHTGTGIKPDVKASDDPSTAHRDEALDAALKAVATLGPGR
jgi:carboxyl-terminal processing protease